jgi:methionine synthase I (cobalamin-dependent)
MVYMPCQTILVDAAMGTRLQQLTGNWKKRPPLWNIERPELVRQIHERYRAAGAEILLTNTFDAREDEEFEAALDCVQGLPGTYSIAGSFGPTTSQKGATILAAGVDLFVLETFSDLREARRRFVSLERFGKPIAISFAWILKDGFRLFSGESFKDVIQEIRTWPLFAAGANCNLGTIGMIQIGKMLKNEGGFDVWIKSNAGQPRKEGESFVYNQQPAEFASDLEELIGVARYLGGCCGTDESHLRTLATKLENANAGRF